MCSWKPSSGTPRRRIQAWCKKSEFPPYHGDGRGWGRTTSMATLEDMIIKKIIFFILAVLTLSYDVAVASIVNEPMTGATAPGWVIGGSAYLTASTGGDPAGSGWLRLTE